MFSKLKKKWAARNRWKHCECGMRLSEWFIDFDQLSRTWVMYCPKFAGGCGRLSPHESHNQESVAETGEQV